MHTFRQMFINEAERVQGTSEGLCTLRHANPAAFQVLRRHQITHGKVRLNAASTQRGRQGCRLCLHGSADFRRHCQSTTLNLRGRHSFVVAGSAVF